MALEFTTRDRGDFFHIQSSGIEEDVEQTLKYNMAMYAAFLESGHSRVLLDERNVIVLKEVVDLFSLVEAHEAERIARKVEKLAIVGNPEFRESNRFFEDASRNRGLFVKMFYELESAEAWLRNCS